MSDTATGHARRRRHLSIAFPLHQAGTQRMAYYAQLGLMPAVAFAGHQANGHVLCTRSSVREDHVD